VAKSGYPPEIERLVAALCDTFVVRERRDRLAVKPDEFLDRLCHHPGIFDRRQMIAIPRGPVRVEPPQALRMAGCTGVATYLGAWEGLEVGSYPIDTACAMVDRSGGALASSADGRVAYYKSEDGDRFLLVSDPVALGRVAAAIDQR